MRNSDNGKRKASGFTIIETLITMALFIFILYGVYIMVIHYGDVSRTEHSRVRLQQESRFMISAFASELKEAGSVLTVTHTGSFLAGTPYFNGIYPLNQNTFPDGLIIATGDPEAVTTLTQARSPGENVLNVENASVAAYNPSDPFEIPQWTAGDKGILIGKDGYYVFSVADVDTANNTITMRDTPVYYSGLLDTAASLSGSQRYTDSAGTAGNAVAYPKNAPVIRLTNFSIYLFREVLPTSANVYRNIRQLIRVTDTFGSADVLANGSGAEYSVVTENLWDMQISYVAYTDFKTTDRKTPLDQNHHYFAGGTSSTSLADLLTDIRTKMLKRMDIDLVSITDEYEGKGTKVHRVPPIGDRAAYNLPEGKFGFKILSLSIDPRNYSIIL